MPSNCCVSILFPTYNRVSSQYRAIYNCSVGWQDSSSINNPTEAGAKDQNGPRWERESNIGGGGETKDNDREVIYVHPYCSIIKILEQGIPFFAHS